ncbi:MAG TPA: MaoC/PaaZ C-terminal domain-containing protein [Rhizobiaceae bacterium]|nr:MaoC/PaaZ C-terminal domain-containing protein [Rhizobiaceae bacterium]
MVVDLRRLLGWQIPDKVQLLTRRDVAFYALSIGAGRDPNNRDQLKFVDPDRADLQALPSMALVLGYPGFWLGDPELGLDIRRILHVEQSIEIIRQLPVEGRIVGRTRVTKVCDRGPGKGVLVHSERNVLDDQGQTFAKLSQVHMLRGYGGFSGVGSDVASPRSQIARPPAISAVVDMIIRPEQALFYRMNGDTNPIHSDPTVAREAGFAAPIMHGMCTFGMVAKKLVDTLCDGDAKRLVSMSARFTGPVHPGETLRTEIGRDGSFHTVSVDRNTTVLGNGFARTALEEKFAVEVDHAV